MDLKAAAAQVERYHKTIATLRSARKAIEAGPPVGIAALDEAIQLHEAGALEFAEEVAATDWWQASDVPALATLIPPMAALVGVTEGGPVVRLALHVGRLCRPYDSEGAA